MSLARPADWRMYWKRAVRYGRRRYEFQLLGTRLKAKGIGGLPRDITELYADAGTLRLRWDGVYTLPQLVRAARDAPAADGERSRTPWTVSSAQSRWPRMRAASRRRRAYALPTR